LPPRIGQRNPRARPPRPHHSSASRKIPRIRPRRKRLGLRPRLALGAFAVIAALLAWATVARLIAPTGNASLSHFDAIIVLGSPADSDGNPKPTQLSRVTEAVREYQRGVAPRLILTGGPAHNQFVEARVMARSAEADGIPASAIYMEPEALDTIHDACYAARIMKAHGWRTAEVVPAPRTSPAPASSSTRSPKMNRRCSGPCTPTHRSPPTPRLTIWLRQPSKSLRLHAT
jgi:hypothetical protein